MKSSKATVISRAMRILLALAANRFGLTRVELAKEAKISVSGVDNYIRALEASGIKLRRERDPVRGSWRLIYRIEDTNVRVNFRAWL